MQIVRVALDVPLYRFFDYLAPQGIALSPEDVGLRVRVPFGKRLKVGLIIEFPEKSDVPLEQLKAIEGVFHDFPALPPDWFRLCEFCANYYQHPQGEVMLSALPTGLKRTHPPRPRARKNKPLQPAAPIIPVLTGEQEAVLRQIEQCGEGFHPYLLRGITGSGKTEVYLRLIERVISMGQQALILVPEINLTPQLETRLQSRFPQTRQITLHSGMTQAARVANWRAAFDGSAHIILGTRLAVFTPMLKLGLIVVDEEHDPSFKQQDGIRYSARDLAVFRAQQQKIPVILGSATPSIESWANAVTRSSRPHYTLLSLGKRAVARSHLPTIQLIDTRREKLQEGFSENLLMTIEERLARDEQSLIFLNRRGYAPVLVCMQCGWASNCFRCAANLVVHLVDARLRCHYCGFETKIPKMCATCGNQDIHALGRGTQRLEAFLTEYFTGARIMRIDRDSARSPQQWDAMAAQIHHGEVDILVGTQMLAKGHDFPKLTLVGVIGADAALFAADWRAPERLFAQLMQVGGRAGRTELAGDVLIQTRFPDHPLYEALMRHDYETFANSQLVARQQAGFPPYTYQAMLRAEARKMKDVLSFLEKSCAWDKAHHYSEIRFYDPVPMRLTRRVNMERAQLLVESDSRRQLQEFLGKWVVFLTSLKKPGQLSWHLEVDPVEL